MAATQPSPCQNCNDEGVPITTNQIWLEQRVVAFFRLWHMIFLCSGGVLAIIIFLCCCFKCRIPRTKQEIESDFRRKKVTRKFRRELDKMQMEEIDVKDIQGDKVRDKFSGKSSLNKDDENGEAGPSGTVATLKTRLIKMFAMPKKPAKSKTRGDAKTDGAGEEGDEKVFDDVNINEVKP